MTQAEAAPTQKPDSTVRHLNTFDFLRLFAATCVVITHSASSLGTRAPFHLAEIDGVGMFFIMSGLLVWRSGEVTFERTGSWTEFFRNRLLRVAPAIWAYTLAVMVLLVALGAVPVGDLLSGSVAAWVLMSFALVPNLDPAAFDQFGTGVLNGPLWSIPAEVSFYVAVPFMVIIAQRVGFSRLLMLLLPLAVAAPLVSHAISYGAWNLVHHTFAELLVYFMAGMFLSKYGDRLPMRWWLFAASVVVWYFAMRESGAEHWRQFALVVPMSYAIYYFGYHGPKALTRFTRKIGDISFGTYIWHFPVINYFAWKGLEGHWWTLWAVLLVSWGFGLASWWLVERSALKLKRVSARQVDTGEALAA